MSQMTAAFSEFVFTRQDDAFIEAMRSLQSINIDTTVLNGKARRQWIAHATSLGFVTVKDFSVSYRRFCKRNGYEAEDIIARAGELSKYNMRIVAMGGVDFVLGIRHAVEPKKVEAVRQNPRSTKKKHTHPPSAAPNRAQLQWQRAIRRQIKLNREDRRQTALNRVERRRHELMCLARRRA